MTAKLTEVIIMNWNKKSIDGLRKPSCIQEKDKKQAQKILRGFLNDQLKLKEQ